MADLDKERGRRHTFAIISHPDASKTTLTEKLLLFGGAIQLAGTVKGRRRRATPRPTGWTWRSRRGISVTFGDAVPVQGQVINLLDTPGTRTSRGHLPHADGGRLGLMVIDVAKGCRGAHHQADGGLPPA